jgi:hypothetical protein
VASDVEKERCMSFWMPAWRGWSPTAVCSEQSMSERIGKENSLFQPLMLSVTIYYSAPPYDSKLSFSIEWLVDIIATVPWDPLCWALPISFGHLHLRVLLVLFVS